MFLYIYGDILYKGSSIRDFKIEPVPRLRYTESEMQFSFDDWKRGPHIRPYLRTLLEKYYPSLGLRERKYKVIEYARKWIYCFMNYLACFLKMNVTCLPFVLFLIMLILPIFSFNGVQPLMCCHVDWALCDYL